MRIEPSSSSEIPRPASLAPRGTETVSEPAALDKDGKRIRAMFGRVAPRYDLLNRLLSARLDVAWRRRSARALDLAAGSTVADLCCGTGDQALALTRLGYGVVAADFCLPMLALARGKYRDERRRPAATPPRGLAGDSLRLPLPSGRFDGATVSFGLRNVADLDAALGEMVRILRPGGRVAILEFAVPTLPGLSQLYLFYFRRLLPWIGRRLSPDASAYRYLPDSVLEFPQREAFVRRMTAAGLEDAGWQDLAAGIVALYTGRRREARPAGGAA